MEIRKSSRVPKPIHHYQCEDLYDSVSASQRKVNRKVKPEDVDYTENGLESDSSCSSTQSLDVPKFEDTCVLKSIKVIPERVSYSDNALRAFPKPCLRGKAFEFFSWYSFVVFMKAVYKSVNPYEATTEHLRDFYHFLKSGPKKFKFDRFDCVEFVFAMLQKEGRTSILGPEVIDTLTSLEDVSMLRKHHQYEEVWIKLNRPGYVYHFILFAVEFNKSPFECDPQFVVKFLRKLHRSVLDITVLAKLQYIHFLVLDSIVHFHNSSLMPKAETSASNIADSDEVKRFLTLVKSADFCVDSMIGTRDHQNEVFELMPDCKFVKYSCLNNSSDFWKEEEVGEILFKVFQTKTDSVKHAASLLGVSVEMILSHNPTLKRKKVYQLYVRQGREEEFWMTKWVETILENVRNRDLSYLDAAFQLGCAVQDLKNHVGNRITEEAKRIQMEEKKQQNIKPKLNPLEKLLKFEEGANLSDYGKVRLKNIREREELFRQMGFGDLQRSLATKRKFVRKSEGPPRREKSRRLTAASKKLGTSSDCYIKDQSSRRMTPQIPCVPFLLQDVPCPEVEINDALKFLSCLEQEVLWSEKLSDHPVKAESEVEDMLELRKCCSLSLNKIISSAIFPSKSFNLVCAGDSKGALCIWIIQEDEDDTTLFDTTKYHSMFRLHSTPIRRISFNPTNIAKVVTSSEDGFIRVTDLISEQTVDTYVKWNNFVRKPSEMMIGYHDFISDSELLFSVLDENENSCEAFLYDPRSGLAQSLVREFRSPAFSVNMANRQLISVVSDAVIQIYDIRKTSTPVLEIYSPPEHRPRTAQFSPQGDELLVTAITKSTKESVIVLSLRHGGSSEPKTFDELSPWPILVGTEDGRSRELLDFGYKKSVWHPTKPGSVIVEYRENSSSLTLSSVGILRRNYPNHVVRLDQALNVPFGFEGDEKSSALVAMNTDGNGTLSYFRMK